MHIRQATIADCADLAILDNIAGHGLPLWLWQGAVLRGTARNAMEWGRERYADQSQPCNWTNAAIAEMDRRIAGAAVGYFVPDGMRFPSGDEPVIASMMRIFAKASGSWAVDMLAVYRDFARQGIARALLRDQYLRADGRAVSLVAADDNETALALYRDEGFVETAREPFVAYTDNLKTAYWLLLRRQPER